MQLRSRSSTATALMQITKVLKPKKGAGTRVQKTASRTIVSSNVVGALTPLANGKANGTGGGEDSHPLELDKADSSSKTGNVSKAKAKATRKSKGATEAVAARPRAVTPTSNLASSSDPTLASLTSPTSHRLLHLPHSDLHASFLQRASQHLISVDPRFKALLEQHHCYTYSPQGLSEGVDPFKALASGIFSQQVSGAAARSITRKFLLLFKEQFPPDTKQESKANGEEEQEEPPKGWFPTPHMVLGKSPEILRTAGLSGRKVEYVLDLAGRFADGRLKAEDMIHDSDETIIEKLVEVRGIGQWSAEMFLMFALKRPDVLSTGDLGIQRGMAMWVGKNIANAKGKTSKWKYMSEKEMLEEGEKWRPYRSLGAWCMWRVEPTVSAPAIE